MDKISQDRERTKVIQFLMRLNDNFESVRINILSMEPMPDMDRTYYLVLQVEKQKEITSNLVIEPTAFYANNNNVKSE